MPEISNAKVLILATHGFEQSELLVPRQRLKEAGAQMTVVSPEKGQIRGSKEKDWGESVPVDLSLDDARAEDYDAIVLPGGQINPDLLRVDAKALQLIRAFLDSGKVVAAVCHAPWLLVEADVVRGRRVTSYPSLQTDLRNAGAEWVDDEVVTDRGLVTSRRPADIPAFNAKMIEEFAEGTHDRSTSAATSASF